MSRACEQGSDVVLTIKIFTVSHECHIRSVGRDFENTPFLGQYLFQVLSWACRVSLRGVCHKNFVNHKGFLRKYYCYKSKTKDKSIPQTCTASLPFSTVTSRHVQFMESIPDEK